MKKTYISNNISKKLPRSTESGQVVMAAVLVFMTLSLVVVIGISAPIAAQIKNTSIVLETRKTISTAEILNDDAYYRLNAEMTLPGTIVLALNDSTSTATIIDSGTSKQITSIAESRITSRTSQTKFNTGINPAPISHAVHAGTGGMNIGGGSQVIGDVFSNGSVYGSGGGNVVGSVTAASTLVSTIVEDNTDISSIYDGVELGKVNNVQQIAQQFTVSTSTPITAFAFYVKKNGAPANGILRIYNTTGQGDSNVGNSQIGATGSLSAASVNGDYEWVYVYPYAPLTLNPGTKYWVTIETQGSNSANYYTFATNNDIYGIGILKTRTKTGTSWGNYSAASPGTKDIAFGAYIGGVTSISGNGWDKFIITGGGNAGTIVSTDATGALYCQNGNMNNKACDSTQPIPTPVKLPVYNDHIASWKEQASLGEVRNSSWTINAGEATSTSGALKIVGDLDLGGNAILTLGGPLYVTGTISGGGGSIIQISPSYSTTDEFVIGTRIRLNGGGVITGSGTAGSYVVVVADGTDCPSGCGSSNYVASVSGGTESTIFIVPNGTLDISGGADLKAAVAQGIVMTGGSILRYEPSLSDISFPSSLGWSVESWREIE